MPSPVFVAVNNQVQAPMPNAKSKGAAFAFAFFLGYLGIDRFYLGKAGSGLFILFFSFLVDASVFLFGIGLIASVMWDLFALGRGIYYLCLSDDKFYHKYTLGY